MGVAVVVMDQMVNLHRLVLILVAQYLEPLQLKEKKVALQQQSLYKIFNPLNKDQCHPTKRQVL